MEAGTSINIYAIKDYFKRYLQTQHLEDTAFERVEADPIGFLYHSLVRSSWDYEGTVCFENAENITNGQQLFLEQLANDLKLVFGHTGSYYYLSQPISLY